MIDGNFSSTGTSSTLLVEGNPVMEQAASLNNIELTVEEGGHLAALSNTSTSDLNSENFTLYGNTGLGSGFLLENTSQDIFCMS